MCCPGRESHAPQVPELELIDKTKFNPAPGPTPRPQGMSSRPEPQAPVQGGGVGGWAGSQAPLSPPYRADTLLLLGFSLHPPPLQELKGFQD